MPSLALHPPPPSCLMNQVWTIFKELSWVGLPDQGDRYRSKARLGSAECHAIKKISANSQHFFTPQSCPMNLSQGMFLRWCEVTKVTEIESEAWHSVVLATAQTTNPLLALAVLAGTLLLYVGSYDPSWLISLRMVHLWKSKPIQNWHFYVICLLIWL